MSVDIKRIEFLLVCDGFGITEAAFHFAGLDRACKIDNPIQGCLILHEYIASLLVLRDSKHHVDLIKYVVVQKYITKLAVGAASKKGERERKG